jgi:hypothetical protein
VNASFKGGVEIQNEFDGSRDGECTEEQRDDRCGIPWRKQTEAGKYHSKPEHHRANEW